MTVKPFVAILAVICLALAFTTLGPSSCVSAEQVQEIKRQVGVLQADLAAERERQLAKSVDPAVSNEDQLKAKEAVARIEKLEKQVAEGKAALEKATTPTGEIDPKGAIAAASGLLPPPWGQLAPWAVAAVIGLIQQARVQKAVGDTVSVVRSIDQAKIENPTIGTGFKSLDGNSKIAVRELLTPGAAKLIDKVSIT